MRHWWIAMIFVTSLAAYTAAMWILLAFARHAHRRILIMLNANYTWKDAGVLLRRQTKQQLGPEPGRHRGTEPQPPPARLVAIMAPEPERESTVVVADLGGAADEVDAGEALPPGSDWHTMPGRGHVSPVHENTMTMTQPVPTGGWGPSGFPPPPWQEEPEVHHDER